MTKQPTREIHLAHPATADTQECINIGHKEQEAYFNTPMPFTRPEAEQALDWRNQELNSLIRLRDEVQAKVKENEEWITGILQGKRGPRSKQFLRSLRGQNHNLWQTGQALEWRCQNAPTRRDETAENVEKIKQAIEHRNEDYLNSIKSVERGQFPRDHAIFNEERGRTEAAKHEERRFAALARQEQENYSSASAPATLDEARAAANTGLMHLENCVKEKNASEALCHEKQSRLDATRTLLAEEWSAVVEYDLELLEEEVAALRRTVEIHEQRIAIAHARATESQRQKILGLHSKADFDTSHALAAEALVQFNHRQTNRPDVAPAAVGADEGQSPLERIPTISLVNQANAPGNATTSSSKQPNPALANLAALSSEITAKAALRAERQANQPIVLASAGGSASVASEHEFNASSSGTSPAPANHTDAITTLGASALALAAPSTLTATGAITGVSADLGGLISTAARSLATGLTGAASQMLSAPAIGVGAMLYSAKVGEGSDKVPGREKGVPVALLPKRNHDTHNHSGLGREASIIREAGRNAERHYSRDDFDNHMVSSRVGTAAEATRHDNQIQANHLPLAQLAKPAIKPKPRFAVQTPTHSINTSVSAKALMVPNSQKTAITAQPLQLQTANATLRPTITSGDGVKPPIAIKPVLNRASLEAHQLQAFGLAKVLVKNNFPLTVPVPPTVTMQNMALGAAGNQAKNDANGGDCEGSQESCSVRDGTRCTGRAESFGDRRDEPEPNLGKDIVKATVTQKAELGGVGSGTPGGWGPKDEHSARNNEAQKQNEVHSHSKTPPEGAEELVWDSWQNHPKATIEGRQYAQIGDRYYAQHAVDRMQPSSLGSPAGTLGPGRNVTPNMVEHVIKSGSPQNNIVDGVTRTTYWSGDVGVVTENNGNVVVTILRRSGK